MRVSPRITVIGLSLAALLGGCATSTPPVTAASTTAPALMQTTYRPATAAALAFDPPMSLASPMPDLTRDGRSPSAFVGYEEAQTTVYSLYQRDEIRSNRGGLYGGQFDREAYTARTSITTR